MAGKISWLLQQGIIQNIQCYGSSYKPSDNVLMMQVEPGMANQYIKDLSADVKRGVRATAERGLVSRSPSACRLPAPDQWGFSGEMRSLPTPFVSPWFANSGI